MQDRTNDQRPPRSARSTEEPAGQPKGPDLTRLTAAVERLLRRDLEIARERRGKQRRGGWR